LRESKTYGSIPLDIETAPQVVGHPGTWPTHLRRIVDTSKSSVFRPSEASSETDEDAHPHACNDGWITLGQTVVDDATGEETEEFALYLCRCSGAK
jgi:hypothetical protein